MEILLIFIYKEKSFSAVNHLMRDNNSFSRRIIKNQIINKYGEILYGYMEDVFKIGVVGSEILYDIESPKRKSPAGKNLALDVNARRKGGKRKYK